MFATLAGGYPRTPLPGQASRLDDLDALVDEIVDEQRSAGLSIATDGGVRWVDPLRPLIETIEGLEIGEPGQLPDGQTATRPRVVDGLLRRGPIFVAAWQAADAHTDLPVKQVVVGPYTIGRFADLGGRKRETVTVALAEQLNGELRDLAAAGCPMVQVDEPAACSIADEAEWRLFARAQRSLIHGVPKRLHLSLGLLGGAPAPLGHDALLFPPYASYLVDAFAGADAWRFIKTVPPERGIVSGVMDPRQSALDETEPMVWAMAWAARGGRGPERVGVAPSGSLAYLDRHPARRKIERLGESIRVASMGPLEDVAEALDRAPLESRMPELRSMAQAVAAAGLLD